MAKCRPSKWVPWALPGVVLPLLAAYATTSGGLMEDVRSRTGQALSSQELTAWAKTESDGRDYVVQGTAPSQEALDAAVKAVAGTYGVRTVTQTVQIVEPVKMTAPTVESMTVTTATPELKGSWHEGVATGLSVGVGGTTYKLGESPELTSIGGEWLLKVPQPLAEGSYDVTAETTDGTTTLAAAAPGKLVVDLPDPAPAVTLALPTVQSYLGNLATPTLKGTWPEVDAKAAGKNLQVKLGENLAVLGKNPELTSDGAGNWTLVPAMPLLEGELEVMPGLVGEDGKWIKAEAPGKVTIDLTPPPLPELKAAAPDLAWPFALSGKWLEEAGSKLAATFAGKTYQLGTDAALTSDGQGNFSLDPKVELAPGSYDLDVSVTDAAGNIAGQKLAAAVVIPEPVKIEPLKPAAIAAIAADAKWPYPITGTWDERPGNGLTASVAGRNYVLGRGSALTSDGAGKFTFAPSAQFAPGSYDVDFTTTDAAGGSQVVTAKAAIVVPEPPPAPVKVAVPDAVPADAKWPYAITGTWDERPGNSLTASVAGRNYVLGRGAALTSDGAGKFSFAPSARFAPGSYDVDFTTADAAGGSQVVTVKSAIVVPEPPAPTPPPPPPQEPAKAATVDPVAADAKWPYAITGMWDERPGNALAASVAGRSYVLGRGSALTSDGAGKFSFAPSARFAPGSYDVDFTTTDAAGAALVTTAKAAIVVPEPPPPPAAVIEIPAPTVIPQVDVTGAPIIKGTWPHTVAKGLRVTLNERTYVLGGDANLNAKDDTWTLLPGSALANGTYDVVAEATDGGSVSTPDTTTGELTVNVPPPPPPPAPEPTATPYDCLAVMARIGNVFPIRFEYDLTDITKPFDTSVSQYAALLQDQRCTSINVEIEGHADFRGSEMYNMDLSERRAEVIKGMLEKAGVAPGRMSIKALGESMPLDPAETDDARMKNRRVQITAKP